MLLLSWFSSEMFCSLVFIDWFSGSVLLVFINKVIWLFISLVLDRFSKLLTVSLNSSGPSDSLSFWSFLLVFVGVVWCFFALLLVWEGINGWVNERLDIRGLLVLIFPSSFNSKHVLFDMGVVELGAMELFGSHFSMFGSCACPMLYWLSIGSC